MRRIPAALLGLLLTASFASAVIMKVVSLKEVLEGEQHIFVATVDKVDPDKPAVIFTTAETDSLKGRTPFERLPINLTGDAEAKKDGHTQVMLDRLEPGRQAVVFSHKKGKRYEAMAFLEGTWFSLQGTIDDDGKTVRWGFMHCEPYLRRTYTGTTAELKKVVEDGLAKKAEPPKPNDKEKPGFGPPVEKKSGMRRTGGLFGVIPSLALAGPLAIIAALFPGLFARLAVGMKRWRAFLTIASLNSTIAVIYYFTREYLPDSKWLSLRMVTAEMMIITLIGLVWAGRRHRRMAGEEPSVTETPSPKELGVLFGLTIVTALLVASVRLFGPWSAAVELPMREFSFITLGLLAATLYSLYRVVTRSSDRLPNGTEPPLKLAIAGESIALGTLFLCGLLTVAISGDHTSPTTTGTTSGEVEDAIGPRLVGTPRSFELPDGNQVMSGITIAGDKLFLGAGKQSGFSQGGVVFCLDRETGSPVWKFDAEDELKPVFSGPSFADGKIYVGEGLHTDSECRLYCLDAATGKPVWANPFPTASHTEGTPRIANGKVIFTAGDDGLFCADAATGERKWQFPGKANRLHIDGPPAVANGRVFLGSGLYTTALIALDANTGNEIWRVPSPYRSFGAPLALGDRVFYGLGTGNLGMDTVDYSKEGCPISEKEPAGAVLCLEAATGKTIWQYDLQRSVHAPLAADAFSIYAASRDGSVHCLDRKTGKLRWKTGIGPAITAGVAVASANGFPIAVYAVSQDGNVVCLSPQTGRACWQERLPGFTWDGSEANGVLSTPAVVTTLTPTGSKRTLYVGAMNLSANTGKKTAAVFRFDDEIQE